MCASTRRAADRLKRNGPHKAGRFRGGEILLCGSSYVVLDH
jgi:hypothetical protein